MEKMTIGNFNVILSVCGEKSNAICIKRRLSLLYNVDISEVIHTSSETIDTFFIPESKNVFAINWFYADAVSFTASSYPIIDDEILKNKGGKSIKNLLTKTKGELPELWKMKPPFCLFSHHTGNDTLNCFNDFLGVGKLYTYSKSGVNIVSTTPLAIAVAMTEEPAENRDFWDCFQTFGSGIGNITYFKDVYLVEPGSKVVYSKGRMTEKSIYSYQQLLLLKKENALLYDDPIEVGIAEINSIKSFLPCDFKFGLSGGRDSRLVAAMAIKAGLDFNAFTMSPPLLEAEVAERLMTAIGKHDKWSTTPYALAHEVPTQPILERAQKWFQFTSGDCSSTIMRFQFDPKPQSIEITGNNGEIARGGNNYTVNCLQSSPSKRIDAILRSKLNNAPIIPQSIKHNALMHFKASLFEPAAAGITGFHLLDYAFVVNDLRRRSGVATYMVTPIFTPEIAIDTFWLSPQDKISAKYVVDKTKKLIPEWSDIKYFHELIEGTDPALTNKTHTALMLWEVDEGDFYQSIDYVINNINEADLTIDKVKKNIEQCGEGRPRTAQVYEYMFWRAGFRQTLDKIICIRKSIS